MNQSAFIGSFLALGALWAAAVPTSDQGSRSLVTRLAQKFTAVTRYALDGDIVVMRHTGEQPSVPVAKGSLRLAAAPGGKLHIAARNEEGQPEYSIVSDGHKTWTLAAGHYLEQKGTLAPPVKMFTPVDITQGKWDIVEQFTRQVIPFLGSLSKTTELSFLRGFVLTSLSKKDASLAYIRLDSQTLDIGHITWELPYVSGQEKGLVRMDWTFKEFLLGPKVPDSEFTFTPPQDATPAESIELPNRAPAVVH